MKGRKQVLGFRLSEVEKSRHIDDVQHVYVTIFLMTVRDPAQELLEAAPYKDKSLEYVQKKVNRASALRIKNWLDTSWDRTRVDLRFQGGIEDPRWYAVHAESMDFTDRNIELLAKIKKTIKKDTASYRDDSLKQVIRALLKMKAVEIGHDKEGDFFYALPEPSKFISELLKEEVKDETANLAAH